MLRYFGQCSERQRAERFEKQNALSFNVFPLPHCPSNTSTCPILLRLQLSRLTVVTRVIAWRLPEVMTLYEFLFAFNINIA